MGIERATLCMIDSAGRRQDRPLPRMQSEAGLRFMISHGQQTAECWDELRRRNERVRYVRAMLAHKFGEGSNACDS